MTPRCCIFSLANRFIFMRRWLLMLLLSGLFAGRAQAQLYILSGQVTDAANKPVKAAIVQAVSADKLVFATSDSDGLYNTRAATPGKYEVIVKYGKDTWLTRLDIAKGDPVARFYNIQLAAPGKAKLDITTEDPYKAVAYARLRSSKNNYIDRPGKYEVIRVPKKEDTSHKKRSTKK